MSYRTPASALALCLLVSPLAAQPLTDAPPDALQAASPGVAGGPVPPVARPGPLTRPAAPADLYSH